MIHVRLNPPAHMHSLRVSALTTDIERLYSRTYHANVTVEQDPSLPVTFEVDYTRNPDDQALDLERKAWDKLMGHYALRGATFDRHPGV